MIFFRTTLQSRLFTGFAVTIFFCIFIIKSLFFILFSIIYSFFIVFFLIFFSIILKHIQFCYFHPILYLYLYKTSPSRIHCHMLASLPISVSVQNSSLIYTLSYVEHTFLYLYLYKTNKHIFSNYFRQLIINTTHSYAFYIF